jgi:hypothetical protein
MLGALAFMENNEKRFVVAEVKSGSIVWIPIGRVGWDSQNREKLTAEIGSEPMKTALAKAGFAQGDAAFVDLFIANFKRMIDKRGR